MKNSQNEAKTRFIERMGMMFEEDGFARISGRILGYLMLQREPQSLDTLASDLGVSKGSVSTNTRLLEGLGALERVTLPGDRRDYYQVAPVMHERMIEVRVKRFEATQQLLEDAVQSGVAEDVEVRERMCEYSRFFSGLTKAIRAIQESCHRESGDKR